MHRHRRTRPSLERLERRECLSLALGYDSAGLLTSVKESSGGQEAAVSLTVEANGRLSVSEGTTSYGTHAVARNLAVKLGEIAPGPGYINVLQLDNHTLATNLSVSLGDQGEAGPTQFRILGGREGVAGEGTIRGNVRGMAGAGSQFFVFGELGKAVPHIVNITGSVWVNMGPGGDNGPPDAFGSVGVPPAPATVNVDGNVDVFNSTVFVIAGKVGGHLLVDSPTKSADQLVVLGNFGRPFDLKGDATILTGNGGDSISLENATLHRNLTIFSRGGNDYLELANSDTSNDPSNPAFQDAPATVQGSVLLILGDGDDQVDFGSPSDVTPGAFVQLRVGKSLTVDSGAGDDKLNFYDIKVDGPLIDVLTGAGNDTVLLSRVDAAHAHLLAMLGSGHDVLEVAGDSALNLGSLLASGGPGHDTLLKGNLDSYHFHRWLFGF